MTLWPAPSQSHGAGHWRRSDCRRFPAAEDDDIAMVMAASLLREQHLTSAAVEVWEEKRRIGRVDNDGPDVKALRTLFAVKST